MNDKIKKLFQNTYFTQSLNANNWGFIYRKIISADFADEEIGEFAQILLNSGINPLNENFTLNSIPPHMFQGCTYNREIEIPISVKRIDVSAFQDSNIESIIFNSNIERIEFESFERSKIKNLNLKNSNIKYISTNSFIGSSLEFINLSGCNDPTIDVSAFSQCINLKFIILPSIFSINKYAFGGCINLQHIEYEGNVKDFYNNCLIQKGNFLDSRVEYIKCKDGNISIRELFKE